MKKIYYVFAAAAPLQLKILLFSVCLAGWNALSAQVTVTTNYTAGGITSLTGNTGGVFAISNTNSNPITITTIAHYVPGGNTASWTLWYNPTTTLTGAPTAITTANGWIQANTPQSVTAPSTSGIITVITGLNVSMPGNSTWRFAIESSNGYQYQNNLGVPNVFTNSGVQLLVVNNPASPGYTGAFPNFTTNTPRGFLGSVTFLTGPPCNPTNTPVISNVTMTTANFNWNAVTGSQGYEYAITTTATPPTSGTPLNATVYNATGLIVGTNYWFHVRNRCGANSISNWATVAFQTSACPSAGTPSITNNVPGTVSFSWTPASGTIANYQYAVTQTSALPTTWQTTTATSATVNTVTPGTNNYIHVRSNCVSNWGFYQPVQFYNPFPTCYEPATLTISNVNMHGADIVWNSSVTVPAAQGYQYNVSTNRVPPSGGIGTTDTFYSAVNLTGGQKYYVHVRTHCGTTNFSGWVTDSFMTPATCLPALSADITNVTATSADISWTKYPGIYNYEYVLSTSSAAPSGNMQGSPVNFHTLAAANLFSGTNYFFHVRVRCDSASYSPWTTTAFTTQSICTSPSVPSLMNIGSTTATFSWSAVSGAQQYQYCVTPTNVPDSNSTTFTSFTHATALSLIPNTPYFFHVRTYCSPYDLSDWESTSFSTVSVSVPSLAGGDGYELIAYPNPVRDELTVEVIGNIKGGGKVSLYDMTGKLLRSVPVEGGKVQVRTDDLAQGVYQLQYRDADHVSGMRVQKL